MILLDTNLWIYGLVRNEPKALDLIDRIVEERSTTAFDAYSVLEFTDRMDELKRRGVREDVVSEARNDFYYLMTTASSIETYPTQKELTDMSLADIRRNPYVELIAAIINVQAKDVPFIKLAHEYQDADPTIYTADESFSRFDPSEYGIDEISITHVSV